MPDSGDDQTEQSMTTIYRETQQSINEWQRQHFPNATPQGVLRHFQEEVRELLDAIAELKPDYPSYIKLCHEFADVYILLCALCQEYMNTDLHAVVDRKMQVNRARQWNIQPDGTGRHVKE